jgi:eukaryotic-like serine/threonine-protein kinase
MPADAGVQARPHPPIGRYEILAILSQDDDGTLYVASDARMGRRVLLKTVARAGSPRGGAAPLARLLEDARLAGTLSHPNIVPLYDAGEDRGSAYLVFEFVEGRRLDEMIGQEGRLEIGRAVEIAIALAQGLAYAHGQGVFHGDIRAAHITVTPQGVPRFLEFGVGLRAGAASAGEAADLFALGAVLYQMLTGVPPGRAAALEAPSARVPQIDERLDALLMKSLAADPAERFAGAADLVAALHEYIDPGEGGAAEGTQGTLDYLLRRIRHKGDFPSLSATISAVNRAASSEREPVEVLCNAILRDFALTNRLLKIVNASHLNQFGGSISTVSRAIAILGYTAVCNVAMTLVLFEHMQERTNVSALKDQVVAAYFSGLLARELCARAELRDAEEALICAMFHRLGKLLATFYLHDEAQIVERDMQAHGWDEERAAREVLGISYEELGVGVGKAWHLPEAITESMRMVSHPARSCPPEKGERLRLVAGMANELADAVALGDEATRADRLKEIVKRFGPATGITERVLTTAVQESTNALMRDSDALGHGVARSGFLQKAKAWRKDAPAKRPVAAKGAPATQGGDSPAQGGALQATAEGLEPAAAGAASSVPDSADGDVVRELAQTQRLEADAGLGDRVAKTDDAAGPAPPGHRQAALAAGVQDITNTLVGEHSLNDILRIILETIYRAIGFRRVLLFVRESNGQALRCRFGFGADADKHVKHGLAAPVDGSRDIFYAAVVMGVDLCIEDLESPKVKPHIPEWYRKAIDARGMLLLPIVNRKRTLGLIYADSDSSATMHFSAEEMGLLKTLRNQAVLAMRQVG